MSITIASVQLNSQNALQNNLNTITRAVYQAKTNGADLVVLPENACLMGRQADIANQFDYLVDFYQNLAQKTQIHIIAGTLPCPFDDTHTRLNGSKFYQSSLAIDSSGALVARYDKIHLFQAQVNDGIGGYDESKTFLAGNRPTLTKLDIRGQQYCVGMLICFDLRFAKLVQLYRQLGADILVAPSAFTYITGQAHWQLLLQARALDSQCLVVGAAQGGTHYTTNTQRQTWGHSMIVAADGQILANTHQTDVDDSGYLLALANFERATQVNIRQNLPIFSCHRLV